MADNIDDISIHYEEEGQVLKKQLDKVVLTRGSWTTIVFKYADLDRKTGEFASPKASIQRYRKQNGVYIQKSKFNISGGKQARQLSEILTTWFPPEEEQ